MKWGWGTNLTGLIDVIVESTWGGGEGAWLLGVCRLVFALIIKTKGGLLWAPAGWLLGVVCLLTASPAVAG